MFAFIITLVCAVALSVTSAFTFWPVKEWFDFYRPIVMLIAGYLAGIAITWVFYDINGRIMSSYKKKYTKPSNWARFLLNNGMEYIDWMARVRLKKIGLEKIPNEPFLMVSNHKSKFDPMIVAAVFKKRHLAFITKESNMKIPLANRLMWRNCYMPVDRSDKLQSLEQFKKAAELIGTGVSSVGVYPEGSRQEEHVVLSEFHNGCFGIATKTGCPIVIMTMRNTVSIHKNYPWKSTKVIMKCVQVLYKEDYANMNSQELSDYVHKIMLDDLENN